MRCRALGRAVPCLVLWGILWAVASSPVNGSATDEEAGPVAESLFALNQIGYAPAWPKVALWLSPPAGKGGQQREVLLLDADSGERILRIVASRPRRDVLTGQMVRLVDFSHFRRPGRYLLAHGQLRSPSFQVGEGLYRQPLELLLRSFYLQRCGVALDDPETGIAHGACHLDDGVLARAGAGAEALGSAGAAHPAPGGWHDAGDYGKYVAPTAISIARVLDLYLHDPAFFGGLDLRLPDAEQGLPDLLVEMRHGLRWLLAMQRADGAFYRKLSGKAWPKKLLPEEDLQTRYLYGISTPETSKAVAVLAMANRAYRELEPAFAEHCLAAARRGWRFLETREGMFVDEGEGDNSGSGPYLLSKIDQEAALRTDSDDRFWAAAELWLATGESVFQGSVESHGPELGWHLFEWKDASSMGMAHLLWQGESMSHALGPAFAERMERRARRGLSRARSNPYGLANLRFVWGSNKMAAEEGVLLAQAHGETKGRRFLHAALDQLHYLMGRNPFGTVYVTGLGEKRVENPCHIFGSTAGHTIPGLLVGGPNEAAQAKIAPKDQGPLSWADNRLSYATNEYAIDYNASLIGLIGILRHAGAL